MKQSVSSKVFDTFNYIFLGFVAIITIYPFWDVLQISLSSPKKAYYIQRLDLLDWIKDATLDMYTMVLSMSDIQRGFYNSIIQTAVAVIFALTITSLAAYPLSKKIKGKKFFMIYILFTMFFSGGLIPTFILVSNLGILNTIIAITLPGAFSATNMLIMITFFQGIPEELEEAALMEGANELYVFIKIYIPLSKALYATMFLFFAVAAWNNWFGPLIYLDDAQMYPLQLVLRNYVIENTREALINLPKHLTDNFMAWSDQAQSIGEIFKASAMIISMLPMIILYPFIQRYFTKGIMLGAVKY